MIKYLDYTYTMDKNYIGYFLHGIKDDADMLDKVSIKIVCKDGVFYHSWSLPIVITQDVVLDELDGVKHAELHYFDGTFYFYSETSSHGIPDFIFLALVSFSSWVFGESTDE